MTNKMNSTKGKLYFEVLNNSLGDIKEYNLDEECAEIQKEIENNIKPSVYNIIPIIIPKNNIYTLLTEKYIDFELPDLDKDIYNFIQKEITINDLINGKKIFYFMNILDATATNDIDDIKKNIDTWFIKNMFFVIDKIKVLPDDNYYIVEFPQFIVNDLFLKKEKTHDTRKFKDTGKHIVYEDITTTEIKQEIFMENFINSFDIQELVMNDKNSIYIKKICDLSGGGSKELCLVKTNKCQILRDYGEPLFLNDTFTIQYPKDNDKENLISFNLEFALLKSLNHPNLPKVYGKIPVSNKTNHESRFKESVAIEYIKGPNLYELIHNYKPTFKYIIDILYSLSDVIKYLHDNEIIHNDIKPQNIIVSFDKLKVTPKLIDLGLNSFFMNIFANQNSVYGSPLYFSPERINKEYIKEGDIYSFGAIIYECITKNIFLLDLISKDGYIPKTHNNDLDKIYTVKLMKWFYQFYNNKEETNIKEVSNWCNKVYNSGISFNQIRDLFLIESNKSNHPERLNFRIQEYTKGYLSDQLSLELENTLKHCLSIAPKTRPTIETISQLLKRVKTYLGDQ